MKDKSLLVIAIAALPASTASANQHNHIGGNVCQVAGSLEPWAAVYPGLGLMSTIDNSGGTSDLRPVCDVPFSSTTAGPISLNPSGARVDYIDVNNTNSAYNFGAVSCTMYVATVGGTIYNMGTKYSCTDPGGCSSGANTFQGSGYLSFPDTLGSVANAVATNFSCLIPAYQGPYNWTGSSIVALSVDTSTP